MKDIGYYAGFLSEENREKIQNAPLEALSVTMSDLAGCFADDYYYMDDSIQHTEVSLLNDFVVSKLSARDRLAVIRGLCDRIEVKLMEQAK